MLFFIMVGVAKALGILESGPPPKNEAQPRIENDEIPFDLSRSQYFLRKSIMTKDEHNFANKLLECLPASTHLVAKIRIEDVIGAKKEGREYKAFLRDRGRISSRHFDFLIVSQGYEPLIAIELDGSSHRSIKARKIDLFKDELAEMVGLPLVRFSSPNRDSIDEITAKLGAAI
ncbi:MAG: DUF2726 domain-containing protein [Planctomycetota bacterium]